MQTTTYVRREFPVKAVQVTPENMEEVAEWCGGTIVTPEAGQKHIFSEIGNAMNERQKKAYVGDWVLELTESAVKFKFFKDKAFHNSFALKGPTIVNTPVPKPAPPTKNVFQGNHSHDMTNEPCEAGCPVFDARAAAPEPKQPVIGISSGVADEGTI